MNEFTLAVFWKALFRKPLFWKPLFRKSLLHKPVFGQQLLLLASLAILSLSLSLPVQARSAFDATPESDWALKRDKNGIQVYTRKLQDFKHKAVRAETFAEGISIHAAMAVILDAQACPDWADLCKQSYVHSKNSDFDFLVYTLNDLPSPVKNRDALTRVVWKKGEEGSAVMQSTIAEGILPEQKGAVRVPEAYVRWIFTPAENGTQIEGFFLVDPGSAMPAWITNRLLVSTPYKTFLGLIEQARKPAYAETASDFYDNLPAEFEGE